MFEDGKLYRNGDPALLELAGRSTWNRWRIAKDKPSASAADLGPRFIRVGGRVVYRGEDLNAWIEANANTEAAA